MAAATWYRKLDVGPFRLGLGKGRSPRWFASWGCVILGRYALTWGRRFG